jgi:cholest-4-en-3-one 26-monooxygenase
VDLLDLDRWARRGAPDAWFDQIRAESPVWHHPSPPGSGGAGFWVVTGHEEVTALGRCPHAMASGGEHGGVSGLGPGDELQQIEDSIGEMVGLSGTTLSGDTAMLLTLDPPEHTGLRKIVNKGFTPRSIAALEAAIRGQAVELLDGFGTEGDLTTGLAMPLPMNVISQMIGAREDQWSELLRWSNESIAGTDPEYQSEHGQMSALMAILSMFQAFDEISTAHEAEPADDLTTTLLEAEVDGASLSPTRFKMFLFLLAAAGNETTRNGISHMAMELADRPEEWARLKEDRSLVPTAVEEVLRYASPVAYFRRNAIADMEVAGQQIRTGDLVSLWYGAANRDPAVFDDPHRFDVGRTPNPHVAFGGGGAHFCLGASLARLELRIVLEELLDRFERIERTGPVDRLRSNFLHGIKHLPVRLHPA